MSEDDLTAQPETALRPLPGEQLAAAREGRGMTRSEEHTSELQSH